jgi:hypothetical protein
LGDFFYLFFMVSTRSIIPTSRSGFAIVRNGVVIASLSATTCPNKLGVEIAVVYSVVSAVWGVAIAI